jgi:wobble nucleotide-excising tRNase
MINLKSKEELLKLKNEISKLNNNIYFETYIIDDITRVKYRIRESYSLPSIADDIPYKKYITKNKNSLSTEFLSLDKKTKLIIPIKPYATIYQFALNGSDKEWLALFNRVVKNFKKDDKYISTHGHGVSWLHVRIEKIPKYYTI